MLIGLVGDLRPELLGYCRELLPGMEVQAVRIAEEAFDRALRALGATEAAAAGTARPLSSGGPAAASGPGSPELDALLRRMVAERASDLHLNAGLRPRWRIDGDLLEVGETAALEPDTALELLRPVVRSAQLEAFAADNDLDFAYAIPELARFRVNLFRDHLGVGAVLRVIPAKIMTLEQLGLPPAVQALCEQPKGLVLVTGPTGSGKSTTLAAMVDWINRNRRGHILTLEDPIEFVHESQSCVVTQREVGEHTRSFHRALKAALRQDPDVVLVGELRDVETVSLALETANTGHLVMGTLHTATAISTVDRIVDLFPSERHNQVRAGLADVLRGVVAQTLCKRRGGGRIAALEVLVANSAVANLIREGKNQQIVNIMQTGKSRGNSMLNEELARLLLDGKVDPDEAIAKAVDKADLRKRIPAGRQHTPAPHGGGRAQTPAGGRRTSTPYGGRRSPTPGGQGRGPGRR